MNKYGKEILHNTNCNLIKRYNEMIRQKPDKYVSGFAHKLQAQRQHKQRCDEMLQRIKDKHNLIK